MDKHSKNSNMPSGYTRRHVRVKRTPKGKEREVRFEKKGPPIRRVRKAGDLPAVQRRLWQAVLAAEDLLLDSEASRDDQIRAVHALSQAAASYGKLLETTELQTQIDALKSELEDLRSGATLRKVV